MFLRKILDFMNVDNWENGHYIGATNLSATNSIDNFSSEIQIYEKVQSPILKFEKGILQEVDEKPYFIVDKTLYYGATIYKINNHLYNLNIINDIKEIPVPDYYNNFGDVTRYLEYMLRITAGHFYDKGMYENCFECLKKANCIMKISPISWNLNDYLRICQWMVQKGYFQEADKEEKIILDFAKHNKWLKPQYKRYIAKNSEERLKHIDRIEYYKLFYSYPEIAPKSFGAYRRMKNGNTKNYQKLLKYISRQ